ncbi:DUF3566 domain-containing protein [Saccharopolyspora rosea]|uniref:DUF3566 domain-containing protein n=1 Tax=Saccharopolyspora rosea TaxID=524884 RepID=A0ABW3FVE6_9PSEU|nr:DUF3566 domain-containing protein [Saccharopolyspora rosea]
MTPSEKPESSGPQEEADRTPVSTQTVDESAAEAGEETSAGSGEEGLDGTDTPPWQRASATAAAPESAGAESDATTTSPTTGGAADAEDTQSIPKQVQDQDTVRTEIPAAARTSVPFTGAQAAGRSAPAGTARRPSRGPRRASLQIKRLDPWSVLKLALVLSVALFFVWMIAVAVLYGVLDGMGVWDQLNGTFTELTQPDNAASEPLISAGRVFGVASIIGAINIVLITALATVAAFIYNVAADFAGGIEVTLSERE